MVNCVEGRGVKAVEGGSDGRNLTGAFTSSFPLPLLLPQYRQPCLFPWCWGCRGALREALPPGWAEGLGPLGPQQGTHLLPAAGTRNHVKRFEDGLLFLAFFFS